MTGQFSPAFRADLADLMRWRRDVRRFRTDPVPEDLLARGLQAFALAPSVGLSEPWRLLRIDSAQARASCLANYRACNAQALADQTGDRAAMHGRQTLPTKYRPALIISFNTFRQQDHCPAGQWSSRQRTL